MKPSPQGRVLWVLLVLVCVGVAAYLALRHRLFSPGQPDLANPATHRTNLVLQAGSWRLSGTTNLFTGLLVDTYEAGSRKSLTPVSNGLLHGVFFRKFKFDLYLESSPDGRVQKFGMITGRDQ